MGVEVGLYIEAQEGVTWEDWREIASRAEAGGFDDLACSVHLMPLERPGEPALDLWPVLTALALWTRRLHFGPMVLPVTFAHPAQVARVAADLDRLSLGRLRLRLGAGRDPREHRAFGLPFPEHDKRVAMLGEAVEVIRRLWSGETVTFAGRWYRLEGAQVRPRPSRSWIGVGGSSEPSLRLAARAADEWCSGGNTPEALARLLARLDALAREAGRDPAAISRSVMTGVLVGRDAAEARRRAGELIAAMPSLAGTPAEEILARAREQWHWWIGTPEEVAARAVDTLALGFDAVYFQVFNARDLDALDLLAREVLPRVRAMPARR